jgi:hypothetical protein
MSIQQKLEIGRTRLNKAGNDPDLLGLAMVSIHGALEDACRDWLSAPNIRQQHGKNVQNRSEASWQVLLELMQKHCGWSEQDTRYVSRMNSLRNKSAHGDPFEGTRQELEKYLSYVEKAIGHNGTNPSSTSETSTIQYFPDNTSTEIPVSPFRFYIERTDQGVKIFNQKGSLVIYASPGTSYFAGVPNIPRKYVVIFFIAAFVAVVIPGLKIIANLTMIFLVLMTIWQNHNSGIFSAPYVFIGLKRIHVGKKSYPLPDGSYFRCISQENSNLYKVHVLQPNEVVYFGLNLTWHEADELLKIAINSAYMAVDSKSLFSVEAKDGLIFFNSLKTQMSFVVEQTPRLWQSIRCRMLKQNVVQLTKSELEELYNKKLQAFNHKATSQTQPDQDEYGTSANNMGNSHSHAGEQEADLKAARGDDLRYDLAISQEEALSGGEKTISLFPVFDRCTACNARGFTETNTTCSVCQGTGRIEQNRKLTVTIPPGMIEGARLRVSGEGDAGIKGAPAGDLYIYLFINEESKTEDNH